MMHFNIIAILHCSIDVMYCQDKGKRNEEYLNRHNILTYRPAATETAYGKNSEESMHLPCKWHDKWYHYIIMVYQDHKNHLPFMLT